MENFKGTIGRWYAETTEPYNNPECSTIEIHSKHSGGWICKIQNKGVIGELEGKANALLISKSPEMLEMLQQHLEYLESFKSEWKEGEEYLYYMTQSLLKSATELNP